MTKFKMVRHEKSVVGKFVWLFLLSLMGVSASAGSTFKTNTVEGLVYLLTTYNGKDASNVIELAPGDYNLGETKMQDGHSTLGASQLTMNSIRIKGLGATCEATRLIGSGICRVLYMGVSTALENLTVTNGNAKTISGAGSSNRGGALYGESSAVLTNCLFIGNKSADYGGVTSGAPKAYNCQFINNSSANGGAAHGGSYYNSVFAGNTATGDGGAAYNVTRIEGCILTNNSAGANGGGIRMSTKVVRSLIACNQAAKGGGIYPNKTASFTCEDSVISNNTASVEAGACKFGTYRRCVIYGNVAPAFGGVQGNTSADPAIVYDSRIECNSTTDGADGCGAAYCMLSNCVVSANKGYSAANDCYSCGVIHSTAYDTEICGNYTSAGSGKFGCAGGAHNSTLYRCYVHDNYTTSFGGGVRECTCYGCHIKNNSCGSLGLNAMGSKFFDCVIEGTGVYGGTATRTTFTKVGPQFVIDNPYVTEQQKTQSAHYLTDGGTSMTNCLIVANVFGVGDGEIFRGNSSLSINCSVVNCTIVSNVCDKMFSLFGVSEHKLQVKNSLFFGNYRPLTVNIASDIYATTGCAGGIVFDRCAYGVNTWDKLGESIAAGGKMYKFGAEDGVGQVIAKTPRFCYGKDPENPYALLHSSKVRGLGVYQAWMAGANDIRGEDFPRADGTSVDLGCYQCWRPADGMMLLFR